MNLNEHDRAMLKGAAREIRGLHGILWPDCPGGCPAEDYVAKLDALAGRTAPEDSGSGRIIDEAAERIMEKAAPDMAKALIRETVAEIARTVPRDSGSGLAREFP